MRCQMCFKDKLVQPVLQGSQAVVCKGCWFEVDRVLGFLDLVANVQQGIQSALPMDVPTETPQPPLPFDGVTEGLSQASEAPSEPTKRSRTRKQT